MLFNSLEFLAFLPTVFLLYWFVVKKSLTLQNLLLLSASYFFYGWWSPKFLLVLIFSTLLDYVYGFFVASPSRRVARLFLALSIVNNLGILGLFKYYNFFVLQFQQSFAALGFHFNVHLLNFILPVGISFYTFHGMSYVFDIYRGLRKPVSNFIDYAVFVCFFPLLVAGPIERANHLLPQVQAPRTFRYQQAVEGAKLVLWGLFKKAVIADSLAVMVDDIFDNYSSHGGLSLVLGAIGFSFQIYADFSGYSDIAIGTAKLFGFELLTNFRFPYFSRDIAEFWRRWHISLSSWFRDYLYVPLGGSREGKLKTVRNTFVIFLVSGFWHGASWNFIVWGGIHACGFLPLLLLHRNRRHVTDIVAQDRKLPTIKELWQMLTTFTFVTFAWIFFRIHHLGDAMRYLGSIIRNPAQPGEFAQYQPILYYCGLLLLADWYIRRDERRLRSLPRGLNYAVTVILSVVVFLAILVSHGQTFIYFNF